MLVLLGAVLPLVAQETCPNTVTDVHYLARHWCIDEVVLDETGGELGFTAITLAPDHTLYATRPLLGQVLAIVDSDGDTLPDTPQVLAEGLTTPNGIAYHEYALWVSGANHIYRISLDGEVTILVDDVPSGSGLWTGDLVIHDERIYVGTGAPCGDCLYDDAERGAILSYDLDGGDKQVVATGFRHPADMVILPG